MILMPRLHSIARRVRKTAETYARTNHLFPTDLTGMCAIASAMLFRELKAAGYKNLSIVETKLFGMGHCVVVIGYGFDRPIIVDVTATQFDKKHKPVTIMYVDERDTVRHWYWDVTGMSKRRFTSVAALRRSQKKHGWPDFQIA